jgi:hypothetical protein
MFFSSLRRLENAKAAISNHLVVILYSRVNTIVFHKNIKWDEKIYEIPVFDAKTGDPQTEVVNICKDYYGHLVEDTKPLFDFYHHNDRYLCYRAVMKMPLANKENFVDRNLLNVKADLFEGYKYRDAVTLTVVQKLLVENIDELVQTDYQNKKMKLVGMSLLFGLLLGGTTIFLDKLAK